MLLWKRDTRNWTVRPIEGSPYPSTDAEGDTCCENTHFKSESDAWDSLEREAKASKSLDARQLADAKAALAVAQEQFLNSERIHAKVIDEINRRRQAQGNSPKK